MSFDRERRRLARRHAADPKDGEIERALRHGQDRIHPRCQCLKEPYRFFIYRRHRVDSPWPYHPKPLLRSRWLDALQSSFSYEVRHILEQWTHFAPNPHTKEPPPILPRHLLLVGARRLGLAKFESRFDTENDTEIPALYNASDTVALIYDADISHRKKKVPKGFCKRCEGIRRKRR